MAQHANTVLLEEYQQLAADYDTRWSRYVEVSSHAMLEAILPQLSPQARVLDIGCGTGVFLAKLAQARSDVQLFGVEPVSAMLEQAQKRLAERASLQQGWAEALPFSSEGFSGYFDMVVSSSAFHYFSQPEKSLQECQRVLRPQGHLILTDWCNDYLSMRLLGYYLRLRQRALQRVYGLQAMLELMEQQHFSIQRHRKYRIGLWGMMLVTAKRTSTPCASR